MAPKQIRPPTYEAPHDSWVGGEYMKVSDIAATTGLSAEEIANKLRRANSAAFGDFSPDCERVKDVSTGGSQPTPDISAGYIPAYAWEQIKDTH